MQIESIRPQQVADISQQPVVSGVQAVNTNIYGQKKSDTDENGADSKNNSGHRAAKRAEDQLEQLNRSARENQRHVQYTIIEQPHAVILQIVDSNTGKVLDEIPSEKMIRLVDELQKISSGRLDQKI